MHGWRLTPGKISLPFETMKNNKIADPVFTMLVFTTKMIFKKKKVRHHSESKTWRHFSPATMAGYPKLNGFFCACRNFFITCCSARHLTTTDFKGLLYLMSSLFFCFKKVFCVYNNICSLV